mmetsp:Transcript_11833/g.17739  ORF Transcript_11833/g.17739 Transcript_11833/m.17739 type:complete len:404 (-) Transcript_11833:99-1310(-)
MKAQHLLLVPLAFTVEAFSPSSFTLTNTNSNTKMNKNARIGMRANMRMDSESSFDAPAIAHSLSQFHMDPSLSSTTPGRVAPTPIHEAEAAHGMPWSTTIGESSHDEPLLYMPFWEWQMEHMKATLTNFRCDDETMDSNPTFAFKANEEKKARIVSHCYTSDEYRKIRMTYYDAGDNTQVFNSVWYPDPKYNLPILGIDLLSFNRKKFLAIVDFQPLHEKEEDHAATFEHRLSPIKNQYDSLKGKMSSKFYDETQFFSQQMLFARFEDSTVVENDLFPAFQKYVSMHQSLIEETEAKTDPEDVERVMERQRAYDTYSAERDPATGLFASMFGKEWADDYVFDFLFSLSEKTEGGVQIPPMFGGPPPGAAGKGHGGGGGNPFAQKKEGEVKANTNAAVASGAGR